MVVHETGILVEPLRKVVRSALAPLPWWLSEFILFGLKQAWACLFAASMLSLLMISKLMWQEDWGFARYDFLFLAALGLQALFLAFRFESLEEARVIFIYHVVGTVMEIFKVRMGSWIYPEQSFFQIGGVPLFSGFLYASIGSFMARTIRLFDMQFTNFPPRWMLVGLTVAIYLNFYTHHFLPDIRLLLFAMTAIIFFRVNIHYTIDRLTLSMPLVLAAFFSSFFLWIAENIGTFTGTWVYPGSTTWHIVSLNKMGSWYLLLYVSFALVTFVVRPVPPDETAKALRPLASPRGEPAPDPEFHNAQ